MILLKFYLKYINFIVDLYEELNEHILFLNNHPAAFCDFVK